MLNWWKPAQRQRKPPIFFLYIKINVCLCSSFKNRFGGMETDRWRRIQGVGERVDSVEKVRREFRGWRVIGGEGDRFSGVAGDQRRGGFGGGVKVGGVERGRRWRRGDSSRGASKRPALGGRLSYIYFI